MTCPVCVTVPSTAKSSTPDTVDRFFTCATNRPVVMTAPVLKESAYSWLTGNVI